MGLPAFKLNEHQLMSTVQPAVKKQNVFSFEVGKSQLLVRENEFYLIFVRRLYAYVFSPKIRSTIFGYKYGNERKEQIKLIVGRATEFIEKENHFVHEVDNYVRLVERSKLFVQERKFNLAKRFAHQAYITTKKVIKVAENIRENVGKQDKFPDKKTNEKRFHLVRDDFKKVVGLLEENNVYLADLQGRVQIESNLVSEYKELEDVSLDKSKLDTGDLLLSFKSKKFLKNVQLSRGIARMTGSQVTHVAVVIKPPYSEPRMIDSHRYYGGVSMRHLEIKPGEVLIVLRPRMDHDQRARLLHVLREHVHKNTGYSKSKFTGVVPSMLIGGISNVFTLGYTHVPNILGARRARFFCSEFVDHAYKEAGIFLTPKSKHSDMVFPSDITASPFADYVGLIFDKSKESKEKIESYLEKDVKI